MKLINTDNNQFTAIKNRESGGTDYQGAADRLTARLMPGHYADSISHLNLENRPERTEFDVEIVRSVGGMTEHTGKYISVRIEKPKTPAAVALGRMGGSVKSDKKSKSSAANGAKGGRPRKNQSLP